MLKKVVFVLCAILSFSFFMSSANAVNGDYINKNGVRMTKNEYDKLYLIFSDNIDTITEEQYYNYINRDVVAHQVKYIKVISNMQDVISEEEITEEEYNLGVNSSNKTCSYNAKSTDTGSFETTYKKLIFSVVDFDTYYILVGNLIWKIVPYVRSYDVFAFRLKHMSYSNVSGVQKYYVGSSYTDILYNSSSSGYKSLSNGAGFSMNLKDDSNITGFGMSISAQLAISNYNYSTAHIYGTYQHAQNNVTQAQSMSYTLQAGGLGDVVYFSNTTIRNKYDAMSGIELRVDI